MQFAYKGAGVGFEHTNAGKIFFKASLADAVNAGLLAAFICKALPLPAASACHNLHNQNAP